VKALKIIALVVISFGLIAWLWFTKPWSDYSPSKLASMQHPDNLVWNFQNMREIVPARDVKNSTINIAAFKEELAPLDLSYAFDGEEKTLEQFLQESSTTGLMVIKDGVVIHERYLQGASRETLFTSWSMAKSVVATIIAMAVKEGVIGSLDDQVQQYAPQFKGSDYGTSTLRNLLVMSSGIKFVENYADDNSDIRPFFFDSFVLGKNPDSLLTPFKRDREPFKEFKYISSDSHVLSAVLRGAYKQNLVDIVSEKIWQPLGMEASANWLIHKEGAAGQELGYCCLNSRLRDYGRFGQFYLDAIRGEGAGAESLPEGWVNLVRQAPTASHIPNQEPTKYMGRGYSYHFWLPIDAPGVFFSAGIYGQYIWMDAENELVIVRTSADPEWTPRYPESEAVFKAISKAVAK